MQNKERLFFSAIIIVGFLDWLSTVSGILFFGATEVNPLLFGLTRSSMILFSLVKLSAVILIGFTFYKAAAISESATNNWHFTKKFLYGGYSLTLLALAAVVTSNITTIFRV